VHERLPVALFDRLRARLHRGDSWWLDVPQGAAQALAHRGDVYRAYGVFWFLPRCRDSKNDGATVVLKSRARGDPPAPDRQRARVSRSASASSRHCGCPPGRRISPASRSWASCRHILRWYASSRLDAACRLRRRVAPRPISGAGQIARVGRGSMGMAGARSWSLCSYVPGRRLQRSRSTPTTAGRCGG
jgi:hypothetical protein